MALPTGFCNHVETHFKVYEGSGNILLIAPLPRSMWLKNFTKNRDLRSFLKTLGTKYQVDSVMTLTGQPSRFNSKGYHYTMDVFEPRGSDNSGLPGSWSTMCGNGLRAISQYMVDKHQISSGSTAVKILSKSGLREVKFLQNNEYRVNMGKFTCSRQDLVKYVNLDPNLDTDLAGHTLPKVLLDQLPSSTNYNFWSIGLSGDRKNRKFIDGEPHMVILRTKIKRVRPKRLKSETARVGSIFTKFTKVFPSEINFSLAQIQQIDQVNKLVVVSACTHERGLGNSPLNCVTPSCGTGAVAIGAATFSALKLNDSWTLKILMPGGNLVITQRTSNFFLTGHANKVTDVLINETTNNKN